jgi:tRNA A37 methylthiotransferase MiaB
MQLTPDMTVTVKNIVKNAILGLHGSKEIWAYGQDVNMYNIRCHHYYCHKLSSLIPEEI